MSFSSLYISGKYASNTAYKVYQALKPIINLKSIVEPQNLKVIRSSVQRRLNGTYEFVTMDEVNWMSSSLHTLIRLQDQLQRLRETRTSLSTESKKSPFASTNKDRLTELKNQIDEIREKIYDMEDKIMPIILNLPNLISDRVGDEDVVIKEANLELMKEEQQFKQLDFRHLCYFNSSTYSSFNVGPDSIYLSEKVAKLCYELLEVFGEHLRKFGFIDFSGIDFVKSAVVEAVRVRADRDYKNDPFKIDQGYDGVKDGQALHLVGEASLESTCALFAKLYLNYPPKLPQHYVSVGSEYFVDDNKVLSQKNIVRTISLIEGNHELSENEVDNLINYVWPLYKSFKIPIRCVQRSPRSMFPNEFSRHDVQVWRRIANEWVTIGHVSNYGDFVRKRLGIPHSVHIVSSVVVDSRPFIATFVESTQSPDGKFQDTIKCN